MKILWFTNSPSLAAKKISSDFVGESWISSLEEKLTHQEGIELGIAFQHDKFDSDSFRLNGTRYFVLPELAYRKPKIINPFMVRKLDEKDSVQSYLNVVEKFKPDLIHLFGSENNYGLIIPEIKIPVVIHIQGNITVYNHKFFSGLNKTETLLYSPLKSLLKGYSQFHKYSYLKLVEEREKHIFKHCRYFMGRTNWDRRIQRVLNPDGKYYHCEEAIRNDFYQKKWECNQNSKLTLFSILRNNIYKGFDTVFETARLLRNLEIQFTWEIAGTEKNDTVKKMYEKKFRKRFEELNVHFLGKQNAQDIMYHMLDSDIFVHPSHIDNSPNSICEAMVAGMPIVATNTGGTGDILENYKEGLLVQDGDPYAMAGAILDLFQNKSLAVKLAKNARNRALERHDISKIIIRLLEIYEDIINNQ